MQENSTYGKSINEKRNVKKKTERMRERETEGERKENEEKEKKTKFLNNIHCKVLYHF